MRKVLCATTAALMLMSADSIHAARTFEVKDDHFGRPGGTGKIVTFKEGDPRFKVQGPGKCGHFFLGGFAFGHPDPRIKDPKAVCGHGIVFTVIGPPDGDTGTPPLLITPVTTPVAPDSLKSPVMLAVIREQLPQLDKPDGDKVPEVVEMRRTISKSDSARAVKNTPKRNPAR